MTISDYILLLSAIIVVVGWFVNSYLNRRHEIAKKRIDHRLEMLKNYLSFYVGALKSKSLNGFDDVQVSFHLYGYDDEIELVEQIANISANQPNNRKLSELLVNLNVLVRDRLRKQLGLPKVRKQ